VLQVTLAHLDSKGNLVHKVNKEVLEIQGQLVKLVALATSVLSDWLEELVQPVFKDLQVRLDNLVTKAHKEARVLKERPECLVLLGSPDSLV